MRISLMVLFVLLGGCSFMDRLGNKPYTFPTEGQPSAEVEVVSAVSRFVVFNMDENGCFAGTSVLGAGARIHAGENAFMALEERYGNSYCNLIFSFVPEQNAKYVLRAGSFVEKQGGLLGILPGKDYCTVSGQRVLDSGERVPLDLKQFNLRPSGMACLKMRPASE
ncbi:hypothetical protein [Pseudomonas peli]|uniref:hypothetical protein n=1 Tax=Pseudomonas peli TaxID=592361 RepID=UPI00115F8337|nr:hypothetical protein [Pseudomonas peli]NMZ70826.1 hypothetical protein [Pseudomonas peli]|tara:strand:+ start:20025 stop:20522 length:498 start_codon:yes stop_codon:yes gene_type:complete